MILYNTRTLFIIRCSKKGLTKQLFETKHYRVFGLCPSSGILITREPKV
jgi:hypothetical protein